MDKDIDCLLYELRNNNSKTITAKSFNYGEFCMTIKHVNYGLKYSELIILAFAVYRIRFIPSC